MIKLFLISIIILLLTSSCSEKQLEVQKEQVQKNVQVEKEFIIKIDHTETRKKFDSFGDEIAILKDRIKSLEMKNSGIDKAAEKILKASVYSSVHSDIDKLYQEYVYQLIQEQLSEAKMKLIKNIQK